jgi:hypothetical protein
MPTGKLEEKLLERKAASKLPLWSEAFEAAASD